MNKITTIIALLVIAVSARAWNIDYSKYTVKFAQEAVKSLVATKKKSIPNEQYNIALKKACTWYSDLAEIVVTRPFGSSNEITICEPKANGAPDYFNDIPYANELYVNGFIRLTATSENPRDGFYICSGQNCDRLITQVAISYFVRKDLPVAPSIHTFHHLGKHVQTRSNLITAHYQLMTTYIQLYIPTSQIPIFFEDLGSSVCISNIALEYLQPTDEDAMGEEFAAAEKQHAAGETYATISQANYNFAAATYTGNSPADANNDKTINSADVVAVYNYILNGDNKYNGHAYVDLGLPSGTKWATCNVGAAVPEAWGNFYAYGEHTMFSHDLANYTENNYTRPTSKPTMPGWKGWHYPTRSDFLELRDNTTVSKATINGNNCVTLTSKVNGNQLVFPLPGYVSNDGHHNNGIGYYWTDEQFASRTNLVMMFELLDSNQTPDFNSFYYRCDYEPISLRMTCNPPSE